LRPRTWSFPILKTDRLLLNFLPGDFPLSPSIPFRCVCLQWDYPKKDSLLRIWIILSCLCIRSSKGRGTVSDMPAYSCHELSARLRHLVHNECRQSFNPSLGLELMLKLVSHLSIVSKISRWVIPPSIVHEPTETRYCWDFSCRRPVIQLLWRHWCVLSFSAAASGCCC